MRSKDLALRVLSTAATLSIVTSMAASAFAGSYNLKDGSINVRVDKESSHYVKQGDNEEKKDEDGKVTITSDGERTSNTIKVDVEEGGKADITLKDANIKSSTDAAMKVTGKGDVDIELDGNNKLTSGRDKTNDNYHAGLEKNDSDSSGRLTIKDEKNDDGTEKTGKETDTAGSLTATGREYGSGIGGSGSLSKDGESTSKITIESGVITTTRENDYGNNGAGGGIGGGSSRDGKGGDGGAANPDDAEDRSGGITITGGTITADGIGGGHGIDGAGGNGYVTINGGQIKSTNGSGAGIGGGGSYAGKAKGGDGDVLITGGKVEAESTYEGAGIGGGVGSVGGKGTVTITGGNITATTKYGAASGGAGIGGGKGDSQGGDGEVTITGKDTVIEKAFGNNGAGIGGGGTYSGGIGGEGKVKISDGALVKEAAGSLGGAGIGGGGNLSNGTGGVGKVEISDGALVKKAAGAGGGAGIGGGGVLYGGTGSVGKVTIKDATVETAQGSGNNSNDAAGGAGIGNGDGTKGTSTNDGFVKIINSVIGRLVKDKNGEPTKDADGNYIIEAGTGAIGGASGKNNKANDIGGGAHGTDNNAPAVTVDEKAIVGKGGTATVAHRHTVVDWTTTTPATGTEAGEETGICTTCGETVKRVKPATGNPDKPVDSSSNSGADDVVTIDTAISVVNGSGADILHDAAQVQLMQVSDVLYIEAKVEDTAAVGGTLSDLSQLMENGVQTIVFTTIQRTSTIHLTEVVALGSGETPFALNHNGVEASLTVGGADHNELIH